MEQQAVQRLHRVTALIAFMAALFYLFYQVSKGGPFRAVNPFAEDPYDAVGSMAIQVALFVGVLTYARALRLWDDPAQVSKTGLILRGNGLVLFVVWATLLVDATAEIVRPASPSGWGAVLLVELGVMFLLASVCTVKLVALARSAQSPPVPRDLTPADGIDDLWTLARVPVARFNAMLPPALVKWVNGFNSDQLFTGVQWLAPRGHPWRFAVGLGLLVGLGLALVQLQEGLPPNLQIGLVVAAIFISVELAATLLGFAVFGGYLGLRPSF